MKQMKKRKEISRGIIILIIFTLTLLLIFVLPHHGGATAGIETDQGHQNPLILQPFDEELGLEFYLPIIFKNYPISNVFGVHMTIAESGGLNQIAETKAYWVRGGGVPWSWVEPNEGDRNWGVLSGQEAQYINAAENGLKVIVIVGNTPTWAQKVPGYFCGPILESKLDAFGNFMFDLVTRYSEAPYFVKYWEIWSEPDVDPSLVPDPDSPYGCWGDEDDDYYGGRYYGEMLKHVYPRIKQADPKAKVLVGGLLLDCDPNNPPAGKDCKPAKFLEGILINGGGPYFDGVSFHAYDYYGGTLGMYSNSNWSSYWQTTGPVQIAKSDYLMGLLNSYGCPDKFLMNTETAVLCDTSCGGDYETTKAYYVAYAYTTAIAQGFKANTWYTVEGWRNSGLLDENLDPLPAYHTYQFASLRLLNVKFTRTLTEYSNIFGYVFRGEYKDIWVLWSKDGASHVLTLPGVPNAAYRIGTDGVAAALTPSSSLTVTSAPIFLEW